MFGMIQRWWWARQRAIDLRILWPVCKEKAIDLEHARIAFYVHASRDPAWYSFYAEDLIDVISELK